ncbi:MAG: hypothetical protein P8L82_00350 [Paracoccaceae bacterium]|nr:hypothetical protein [Paracoccaceae bacterium]
MDEIISLEKKIDHALEKIKFTLIENRKNPDQVEETRLDVMDKVKRLEEENERLKKKFANLLDQQDSDLKKVDALVEQLNVILENVNG